MPTCTKVSIATLVAAALAACSGGTTSRHDDFQRDLQLASSTSMDLASPKVDPALLNSLETKPQGAPERTKTVRKGRGNRAVRAKSPTLPATPAVEVAAADEKSEQVTMVATAPAPQPTTEPVAVAPRPSPAPVVVQSGDGSGDYGSGGNGGGIFGPGGVFGGVVIRGGGVDGDHCEIHRGGRRGGWPVYGPTSGGIFIQPRVPTGPIMPEAGIPRGIGVSRSIGIMSRSRGR